MTEQWTRGPWKTDGGVHKPSNFGDAVAIVQGDGTILARVLGGVKDDAAVAVANARLISAAPDLYEALRWCVDTLRARSPEELALHPEWSLAHSALAKAQGATT